MASARVLNLTTKCYLKVRQAEGRIEHCVSEWVVQGKSIRDLNLAQIVQKRAFVARFAEPIPFAEIPGLMFRKANPTSVNGAEVSWTCSNRRCQNPVELGEAFCPTCQAPTRQGFALVQQANRFCLEHA